jgi:hypothetical protein
MDMARLTCFMDRMPTTFVLRQYNILNLTHWHRGSELPMLIPAFVSPKKPTTTFQCDRTRDGTIVTTSTSTNASPSLSHTAVSSARCCASIVEITDLKWTSGRLPLLVK